MRCDSNRLQIAINYKTLKLKEKSSKKKKNDSYKYYYQDH